MKKRWWCWGVRENPPPAASYREKAPHFLFCEFPYLQILKNVSPLHSLQELTLFYSFIIPAPVYLFYSFLIFTVSLPSFKTCHSFASSFLKLVIILDDVHCLLSSRLLIFTLTFLFLKLQMFFTIIFELWLLLRPPTHISFTL